MESKAVDDILENLFRILPIIHKKLLRMDLGGVAANLSRLHLAIMGILSEGSLTVTEIARVLVIPKSQMTHLIDHLVNQGIVTRHPNAKDRRVIDVSLTDHGKVMLKKCRGLVKQNIRNRLSCLTAEELVALSDALVKIKDIGAKLE